jgi:uncharacterized membrane protein
MATVEQTAEFNTSVDKAFNFIVDISRWPEWVSAITSVSDISGTGMGTTYNWQFKMGALPAFNGTGEVTKYIPNKRFEVQTQGLPSTWLFKFADRGDQVLISLDIEYDIPGGGVVSGLVAKQIESGLELLRGFLES